MTNASTEVELEKSLNESSLASQTFGTSQLELHARGLGSRLTVVSGGPELSKSFLIEFEDNVRAIESAHALSLVWAEGSELHSPVVDWLLDNYYIVSEQIRDIRDHMPRSFFRELPKLASGRARIHVLAEELVLHCDCSLDEELILRFAENFQSVAELTIGETWAFAVMLRLSLIERLRCLCDQLERDYQSILSIEPILKGLANEEKLSFADLSSVVNASALISLSRAIKELAGENVSARTMFDDHLEGTGWSLIELQKREQHRLASSQVSIGNIITSMRLLGVLDWTKIFEEINCSEKRLRSDPAQIYAQMDFDSRNRYRNAVESLAKNSTRSESSVVELALEYAKKKPTGELDQSIATVRSHVGYWLVDEGLSTIEEKLDCKPTYLSRTHRWIQQKPDQWYFGLTLAIVVFLCTLLVITLLAAGVGEVISVAIVLLAVIPVSEIALTIINAFFTHILPVQLLPKLSLESGVPSRFPTFVVVPSMLTSYRDAETLLSRIESHYLSNAEDNLYFGLLTDFADCKVSEMENDQAILQAAIDGIRKLNRKYERLHQRTPFYLFHRQRVWNSSENKWMGWERKRGKLIEFHRLLLRNAPTNYVVQEGQLAVLEEFRDLNHRPFVITLDSDTILPRGAAKKMIGTLAHPLNQALELGDVGQHSRRGYSILQPRVSVHLGDETKSRYVQVFAHNPGLDPYSSAASDVYQDLFREGSFTGKGIYDLRSFDKSIEGIFPENRILSHDLVEGCHARVGLVTDIEVFDSFPTRYDIDAKRLHRWVRGDWQIAAWLFPTVPIEGGWRKNTLTLLSRWKILDNLRRSAIAPTLLSFLVVGWLLRPSQGWLFSICGALVIFFPVFIQCITSFVSMHRVPNRLAWLRATLSDLVRTLEQSIYAAAFLPHKALMMADAIVRTMFRLVVSKCNLLEWETASATESRLSQKKWAIVRQLSVCSIFAVILFLALNEPSKLAALPWLVLWTTAPLVGQLISLPKKLRRTQTSNPDSQFLLKVMSSTWGFFERFVGVDSHWLPPDNVQEYPREKIANRISPTNEGLFLVSGMAAHQFGFTSTTKLLEYWESNLDSWLSLEQMNGHHFNWYETSTPRVLTPRYVSTVDSGNLLACYLTLSSGIESLVKTPMLSRSHVDGALATIAWLRDIAAKSQGVMKKTPIVNSQHDWQRAFEEKLSEIELTFRVYSDSLYGMACFCRDLKIASDNLENWLAESDGVPQVDNFQTIVQIVADRFKSLSSDVSSILPWLDKFVSCVDLDQPFPNSLLHLSQLVTPQISLLEAAKLRNMLDLPSGRQFTDDDESINTTRDAVVRGSKFAEDLIERLYGVRLRCDEAAQEMDFKLLYNPRRKLFSIGFNADTGQLDRGHYDLLCSECRLSSFLAIAKGDVETEHWFRLGRQATSIDGRYALLSWGGSMFEYLMPTLFQRSYEGSLLDKSCRTAIQTQAEYGAKLDRPWGISESAYSAIGTNSDYQYKSFGVPGLGLKRGLSKDYVVSPYSTALALPYILADASKNLRSMANDAMGDWGFYDAIDYTRSRLRKKESFKVVQNYMAHHHGMSILAIANALNDNQVQKWFHANPLVRANELLLQERVPTYLVSNSPNPDETHETTAIHADTDYVSRHIKGYRSSAPRTLLLSNGRFHAMLTHSGGGYCRFNDIQVTRWRSDATCDQWGSFLYLRDRSTDEVWSATYQPTRVIPDDYEVLLSIDKGEIRRRQGGIESILEVVVSPEHNAEVRQLRLINHGLVAKEIEVTSYMEVVLCTQEADIAHPAFQKLFVETEYISDNSTLIASRRPRDASQPALYALHTISVPAGAQETIEYESSREHFLGRGKTPDGPKALGKEHLSQTVGAVLDPVFSLRCVVKIAPGESVSLGFTTAVAEDRQQALMLADLYHDLRAVQRAFELAWAFAQVELRHLDFTPKQVHLYQQLGSWLLFPDRQLRTAVTTSPFNRLPQNALWRFGISGDVPILLARIVESTEIDFVRELLAAHHFLQYRGIKSDLVICNDHPSTYFDSLQEQIQSAMDERQNPEAKRRCVFLLRGTHLTADDHRLLDSAASVFLRGSLGSLSQQLNASNLKSSGLKYLGESRTSLQSSSLASIATDGALEKSHRQKTTGESVGEFGNGYGSFVNNTYRITTSGHSPTPAPWINVMANSQFGCMVTEAGSGCSWYQNSRENKLTTWSNDPVSDVPSEILYLRDESSGKLWSPLNRLDSGLEMQVEHGQGFSRFLVVSDEIESETEIVVDAADPIKFIRLQIHNTGTETRRLQAVYFAETVLGPSREATTLHQSSFYDRELNAICMTNGFDPNFGSQVMFLKLLNERDFHWTGDRRAFLGREGTFTKPIGLQKKLDGSTGSSLDPCLAVQTFFELPAGKKAELVFVLGAGKDINDVRTILNRVQNQPQAIAAIESSSAQWNKMLEAIVVETPNRSFDLLVNRWLPYQTISCRLWGRSAMYQSGGAYGFRDQLQDIMACVYSRPDLARAHLLRAASRQYIEGDVQHWWHPPSGKGTRTRFSDDFLFLPYATMHYVRTTGDLAILSETISYLESPKLAAHEHERYEQPQISQQSRTLFDHCKRAILHGMRDGRHGLPLIGCGDWNDGMNKVGEGGEGESVWVAWFQIQVCTEFAALMETFEHDEDFRTQLLLRVEKLQLAIDTHAWDGNWYKRAFMDDGSPLGSSTNDECQIDSIAQSWAVIVNGRTPRAELAFRSAVEELFLQEQQMVLLFKPPFDKGRLDPGYIRGYLPGVRENGGQYTHAALWMVQAATVIGDGPLAMQMFDAINPINHSDSQEKADVYKVEPYVLAADVYSNPQHLGRGGWTWYTGSAAWMYRIAIENILGMRMQKNELSFHPVVPPNWPGFSITIRRNETCWRVRVTFADQTDSLERINHISLIEDGQEHIVEIVIDRPLDVTIAARGLL